MSAQRRTRRSITITSALLLSTALAAPAFAEIEEVVVTAQKKAEDIQQVPIAVSAFGAQDLAAHQIIGFKDLQFAVPNVTFTNGNFGPSNIHIRGIGTDTITTSSDEGIAVDLNDVYLAAPPLTNGVYFDTERVEVLRGPQSTLYGRNATGGAINVITNKPDLDNFAADLEGTYGNYNDQEARGMVNVPILDGQLGVRLAGYWQNRDGTVKNVFNQVYGDTPGVADRVDSRNLYELRGSLRWEPSTATTVDIMIQTSHENDTRVRAQVQMCHRDPSGVLGCLPDSLKFEPLNGNATFGTLFASNIGLLQTLANATQNPYFNTLSLFDVADPTNTGFGCDSNPCGAPGMAANAVVPHSFREVDTDFTPRNNTNDLFYMSKWHQDWASWLNMDFIFGYDHNKGVSQESYNNGPGDAFSAYPSTSLQQAFGCPAFFDRLECAQVLFEAAGFTQNNQYFANFGSLPISGIGQNGIIGGNIRDFSDHVQAYDQISGHNTNWSTELTFRTNLEGPFNALFGLYHLDYTNDAEYYVVSNTLDYMGIVSGPFLAGGVDGLVFGPTFYDNNSKKYHLSSDGIYGEVYYNVIPDVLKLTGGLRYLNDDKSFVSRQSLFNVEMPIGLTDWNSYLSQTVLPFNQQHAVFSAWTGRILAEWTPKVDFTDQTMVYASYSRGYRSGGFNPPPLNPGDFPTVFAPETLDAYEIGTKNTLFDGTVLANLTGWYYDYTGYQVSEIIDRTSVNVNINSKLYGVEGEFFWAPIENLQFNMNFGYEHTSIGNTSAVDPRNPAANTPGVTLLKDTNGANCVVVNTSGGPAPTPATNAFFNTYLATAPAQLPGVAEYVAFLQNGANCGNLASLLNAAGLSGQYAYEFGVAQSLSGNEMPLAPHWTLGLGAQYTFNLPGDYNVVPRVDFYWQAKEWGRIFNDGADAIGSWTITNAQIQLNAPENLWYARFWVQNVFDASNVTGMYLTDPSSALFTNVFTTTPRTLGITVGAHF